MNCTAAPKDATTCATAQVTQQLSPTASRRCHLAILASRRFNLALKPEPKPPKPPKVNRGIRPATWFRSGVTELCWYVPLKLMQLILWDVSNVKAGSLGKSMKILHVWASHSDTLWRSSMNLWVLPLATSIRVFWRNRCSDWAEHPILFSSCLPASKLIHSQHTILQNIEIPWK